MAKVTIRVRGIQETRAKITQAFEDRVQLVADELTQSLQDFTPVRTGRARGGWKESVTGTRAEIKNPVPYVQYLEKGTPRMRAANRGRGIIGPSIKSIKGKIK